MKNRFATTVLCAFLFIPPADALAQEHHHRHAATTTVVPAQRWLPDASLHDGIRKVNVAMHELHHDELGHMSPAMAMYRATTIESAVREMFAHCKLAPAPDAALHGILVPLLSAAQTLKAHPDQVAAVAQMRAAIAHYPQYFNDPGWNALPEVQEIHDER